jgi:hypothetical protein
VSTTIILLLAVWLGLNGAFVAIRFYVTAAHPSDAEPDIIGYTDIIGYPTVHDLALKRRFRISARLFQTSNLLKPKVGLSGAAKSRPQ